jgi:hypothetical protein
MPTPHITRIEAAPAADRRRVALRVETQDIGDPAPYLELHILDPDGNLVGEMLVMGVNESLSGEPATEVTLHVRPLAPAGETRPYRALGRLFFGADEQEEQTFSVAETSFTFPINSA